VLKTGDITMKKVLRAIGALTLATCALAASPFVSAADKVILGVSIPTATHGFTGGIVWWANEAKKELEKAHPDLKIIVKTASGAPEQANQLQDLVTVNKINALVIFPFESASLTQPVAQVKKKGVYGKGNIVALRGIPTTLDNERWAAFESVMKQYPDIKILDAKYANWNRDDAFKVMQDYLTRFKHIDAVWAADDDMMVGVLKAIDQAKRTDIKEVFGGAGSKEAVKRIIDGDARVQADVSYSPKFIYDAIKMTADARLKGEKLPPTTIIPSVLITKDNAKQFYYPNSPF
jgi:ribose transport system substrate-binding protein